MKKLNAIFIVLLMFALTTSSVFGGTELENDDVKTSMDIRDRLQKENLNIMKNSTIKFFVDEEEVDVPTIGAKVVMDFAFSIEKDDVHKIVPNDYFEFELPDVFKISGEVEESLQDFASFSVFEDDSGIAKVRIYFKDSIREHSNVGGMFKLEVLLDENILKTPGDYEIKMPVENESDFNLTIKPSTETNQIEKQGRFDRDRNPDGVVWDVYINKSYSPLDNVIVEDIMPEGLELQSVQVFQPFVDHHGNVDPNTIKESINSESGLFTINGTKVEFHENIDKPYLIRYTTKIKEEFKPENDGDVKFTNEASMTTSNASEPLVSKATIVAKYGKLLEKTTPEYNSIDGEFLWTIHYNHREKTIENAKLIDTFDKDLEYVEDSLIIKTMDNEIVDKNNYTIVADGNTLKIEFNETIETGYTITYKTKVKDGVLITENREFKNNVTTESEESSGSTGIARPRLIEKHAGTINYTDRIIPWEINVNINRYELNDYSITDIYRLKGLTLNQKSFKVYDMSNNKDVHPDNYTLEVNSENNIETGFTLTFKGDYEQTSSQLRIVFDTHYDINSLEKNPDNNNTFINDAILSWTDYDGKEHENNTSASSTINYETLYNGSKHGTYNAVTKEITWQVNVNYNSDKLANAKIEDVIEQGQSFILDSLEIYSYKVHNNGVIELDERLDLKDFEIEYPSEENNNTLLVHFPDENDLKYALVYKTSVASETIRQTYKNSALFSNNDYDRKLDASVTVVNGNKFISKSGIQDGDIVNWEIKINESQSTIRDAEIIDKPSMGQILLEDTFVLYPVIVEPSGAYTVDESSPLKRDIDYELIVNAENSDEQTFVLKFLNEIDRTYVLRYSSQLSLPEGQKDIKNKVIFKGNEITHESDDGETTINLDSSSMSGSAWGSQGDLIIKKINPQGEPLVGVEFELINVIGRSIGKKVTDEEGMVHYKNLILNEFTLYEREANSGYVIDEELFNGLKINLSALIEDGQEYVLTVENRMNEVLIKKTDSAGNALEGARFELKKVDGDQEVIIANEFEVSEAGRILYGLEAGDYELKEVVAPEGYIINESVYKFTISVDENNQELDKELSIVNYQGSVQLTKTDEQENVLEGVVFDLYDESDELVKEALVTDENGQITLMNTLAPGTYYFKEVSSVDGNIVNESPLHFTIARKSVGEPEVVSVSATNFKGSVQFKKVSERDNGITGVQFTLYDEHDEVLAVVNSDDQGNVRVNHLQPGKYYFKESEALSSYIHNTQIIEFEIVEKTIEDEVIVKLENFVNYQGHVTIRKINEEEELIKEATFKIVDEAGVVVKKFETIEGQFTVEGLKPGTYALHEVSAPDGYMLSDEIVEFTIPQQHEGVYVGEVLDVVNTKFIVEEPEKPSTPNKPKDEEQPTISETSKVEKKTPTTGINNLTATFNIILIGAIVSLFVLSKRKKERR